jgi:hypothetical protein
LLVMPSNNLREFIEFCFFGRQKYPLFCRF